MEEESRPRFLFQARASPSSYQNPPEILKFHKLQFAAFLSAASLLLFSALSFFQSETLTFLLVWISLSLLVAPFAPSSITGGDVRAGREELLEPFDLTLPEPEDSKKRIPDRRTRSRKPEDLSSAPPIPIAAGSVVSGKAEDRNGDPI